MRYREAWYIRAFDAFDRIPSWAQPAVVGSAILGAIVSIRPVFAIPAILAGKLQPASQALVILGSAMGAGDRLFFAARGCLIRQQVRRRDLVDLHCALRQCHRPHVVR